VHMGRIPLPIDSSLSKVIDGLRDRSAVVLQATPGSGKTTRVPPALLESGLFPAQSEILILEPRRLAAKWAAKRVADEMGVKLGSRVGYQFRFENVTSAETRLTFLTEGMLMRRMLSSPELRGVSAVVLDEFHERHLHGDVAIAYLRSLQLGVRPDLKLVVMSATLDTGALTSYLGGCPLIQVDTRVHPIEVEHLKAPPAKHLDLTVKDAVLEVLAKPAAGKGHILVFLPGMGEIRRAQSALEDLSRSRGFRITPLHGELSREEQDDAIAGTGIRRVILATNVAETSLTIEGVTAVIDSGFHRVASYSWWSGVPALRTRPVSQASAIQRAGRAGRTVPGFCLRLFTKADFSGRPQFQTPEIRRSDLSQTVLELKAMGVGSLENFPWFERPEGPFIESSVGLLSRLGALDSDAKLTEIGRKMSKIPAHPRLARVLIEADRAGVLEDAATLAAMISEGELDRFDALESLEVAKRAKGASWERARKQFLSCFDNSQPTQDPTHSKLTFAILTGFPDRVGKRRAQELVLSAGGSAQVPQATQLGLEGADELFVCVDIQEAQGLGQQKSKLTVRSTLKIEPEMLFDLIPSSLRETDDAIWDSQRKRVTGVSRLVYDELVISESVSREVSPEAKGKLLAKMALGLDLKSARLLTPTQLLAEIAKVKPAAAEDLEGAVARIVLLNEKAPDAMKSLEENGTFQPTASLIEFLISFLAGKSSGEDLSDANWSTDYFEYLESVAPGFTSQLEREMPGSYSFPNGKKSRILYKLGQQPWMESALQNFFGVKQAPSVARGRVPIVLHLLAPNQRALQVTQDLPGFWIRVYPELRTQLSRRYPRHSWPEDPSTAAPVKR
jgi:ATP-dependent helicase HrpB